MRSASWVALLLVLGGCAAKARTTAAAPSASVPVRTPPPEGPKWAASPASVEVPVRAAAWEELAFEDPERLVRDLSDAKACVAVRTELARLVGVGLARARPPVSAKASGAVRSALERVAVPGCAIARRECRTDGQTRRWCWSEGVLDSSVARQWVRRELPRIDSARTEALLTEVFRSIP